MSELVLQEPTYELADTDAIDLMVAEREQAVDSINAVAGVMADARASAVLGYFIEAEQKNVPTDEERLKHGGNWRSEQRRDHVRIERLFLAEPAIKVLDARMWQKAMELTDVRSLMPAADRNLWDMAIQECNTLAFTEDVVRNTLPDLLAKRVEFFAHKIDGVFKALSGEHVTNRPSGFNTRMILANVFSEWASVNYRTAEYVQDLIFAISKFMGMPEPLYDAASSMLRAVRKVGTGEWVRVMGGAMRVRVYLKGTAHIEIHPEMAAKLNQMLHHLYPAAIPPAERSKPKKVAKEWGLMQRPLPFEVLQVLANVRWGEKHACAFGYGQNKTAQAEADRILVSLGAARKGDVFQFDYDASQAIALVVASGCIPDDVSHQFYPTPEHIAERVIELAEIEPGMRVLEPSAGTGDIAVLIPGIHCIEVSALRCDVLRARGLSVEQGDFLKHEGQYDRIVMNPPFSEGRWQAHIQHAYELLASGGRMAAVIPSSAKGKELLPGCKYHDVFDFPGTSIQVVLMTASKD